MGKIQYDYEAIFIDVGQGDATIYTQLVRYAFCFS